VLVHSDVMVDVVAAVAGEIGEAQAAKVAGSRTTGVAGCARLPLDRGLPCRSRQDWRSVPRVNKPVCYTGLSLSLAPPRRVACRRALVPGHLAEWVEDQAQVWYMRRWDWAAVGDVGSGGVVEASFRGVPLMWEG